MSRPSALPQDAALLLVEDEGIIALAQKQRIEKLGYQVVTAHSGEHAVAIALEKNNIRLVLMDIDLGSGIDGTEAARRILEKRKLPVVFLTSHAEKEYVHRVREITRYGYVLKNAGDFVLESAIEMAFTLFDAHEELRQVNEELSSIYYHAPFLIFLVNEDNKIRKINNFAGSFLETIRISKKEKLSEIVLSCLESLDFPGGCGESSSCKQCPLHQSIFRTFNSGETCRDTEFRKGPFFFSYSTVLLSGTSSPMVLVTMQDITARKETEGRLKESRDAFGSLVNMAQEGIYLMQEARYTFVNDSFCLITGYSRDELLSPDFSYKVLLSHRSLGEVEERKNARIRGELLAGEFEVELIRKSGDLVTVKIHTTPIGEPSSLTIIGVMKLSG